MLDNTIIVYLSDAADKHHGSCFEWPFVMLGGKQHGGRYLQYPGYQEQGHRTIGNFYNTLMHLAGKPQDQFGRLDASLDTSIQQGPLSELLV